jgi:cell division septation protein DedD
VTAGKAGAPKRRIAWGRYLLLLFIAAWMFVLGVLVGRGTAPVQFDTQALQKELASLRDAMLKKERAAMEKALRGQDDKAALKFYEALGKDGPDDADVLSMAPAASGDAATPAPPASAPSVPHKSRPAIMAKKTPASVGVAAKTATSRTQTESTPTGQLTIQVAAVKDAAAARRIVAKLKQDGYPAYVSTVSLPKQGDWYRVRVGSYDDRRQAAADMDRLRKARQKPILLQP